MSHKALDTKTLFDDARSMASGFTVGAVTSTNSVDMGAPNMAEANGAEVVAYITGGTTTGSNGTIQLVLQDSADNSSFATILTGPASSAQGANWTPYRMPVPPVHRRYLRVQYTVGTNAFTAGTLTCGLA
jgi:hypothetical protein